MIKENETSQVSPVRQAFGIAAPRPEDYWSSDDFREAIIRHRPDLKDALFYQPGVHTTSHVWIVGDEVFKAPKSGFAKIGLEAEYENLQALQGKGLPVPIITGINKDPLFYSMKRMQGVVASTVLDRTSEQQRAELGKKIGAFIHMVANAFPPQESGEDLVKVSKIDMTVFDIPQIKINLGEQFDFCRTEMAAFAQRASGRKAMMMHFDLHGHNILMNPETSELSGIVDFGDMKYKHIANETLFPKGSFPEDVESAAWNEYTRLEPTVDVRDRYCIKLSEILGRSERYALEDRYHISELKSAVNDLHSAKVLSQEHLTSTSASEKDTPARGSNLRDAFARWSRKEYCEFTREDVIEAIKSERPDLSNAVFLFPVYGAVAHVVMTINEVFKAPKRSDQIEAFQAECEHQNLLSANGLPVPEITCIGKNASFFGMKRMSGAELAIFSGLTKWEEPQLDALAKDLAEFFYGVAKAYPVPEEAGMTLPARPKVDYITKRFEEDAQLRQCLGEEDYAFCMEHMKEFEKRVKVSKPVMIHDDVHMGNILVNRDTRRLVSVLDFGAMRMAYPQYAGFFSNTSIKGLAEKVWIEYARLNSDVHVCDPACYSIAARLNWIPPNAIAAAYATYGLMIKGDLEGMRKVMSQSNATVPASGIAVSSPGPW